MKNIIKLLAALCTACIVSAQTPPTPMSPPDYLPIGQVATVEALARATKMTVVCSQKYSNRFTDSRPLVDISSVDDLGEVAADMDVDFFAADPKGEIIATTTVTDKNGVPLLESVRPFNMERVFDQVNQKYTWQPPYYAGDLYFQLLDSAIDFPGVQAAWLVRRSDKQVFMLEVRDGKIIMPGWMNRGGEFSELIINGIRYDMVTGIRLDPARCQVRSSNVSVGYIEPVDYQGDWVEITTFPQYGYVPSYQIKVVGRNYFRLQFEVGNENWSWIYPTSVRVTTLQDLQDGGQKWTTFPYSRGMTIPVAGPGTYFVIPEYMDRDIGSANGASTPVTQG
jgi:hypothetical protein